MKKRDKTKQDKLHKITRKRALYEKARKQKIKANKSTKDKQKAELVEKTN